jgi:hypothetical protein
MSGLKQRRRRQQQEERAEVSSRQAQMAIMMSAVQLQPTQHKSSKAEFSELCKYLALSKRFLERNIAI